MKTNRRPGMVLTAFLLFASAARAQLDTGTITVAVRDATGAVVPQANVVLRNENTGVEVRTGVTNEQGNFNAPLIPSGSYSVHVELRGFKSLRQSGVYLRVNEQLTVQVALQVGELTEQLTVDAIAPMVEATSGVLRETVDHVRVSELPLNGRNVLQLQVLVPGSVSAGSLDQSAGTPGYAVTAESAPPISIRWMVESTRILTSMRRCRSPTRMRSRSSPSKRTPTLPKSDATAALR